MTLKGMQTTDVGYADFQIGRLPPSHMKFELAVIGELIGGGDQGSGRLNAKDAVDFFYFSEPAANGTGASPKFTHYRALANSQVLDITF